MEVSSEGAVILRHDSPFVKEDCEISWTLVFALADAKGSKLGGLEECGAVALLEICAPP
jgi:hypothetical protein